MGESRTRGALALTNRPIIGSALRHSCRIVGIRYLGFAASLPADEDVSGDTVVVDVATSGRGPSCDDVAAVIVLTPPTMSRALHDALERGADAVVTLADPLDVLTEALRTLADGAAYLSPTAGRILLAWHRVVEQREPPKVALSDRDRDVLEAMVEGLTTKATARRLGIAIKTVEAHRSRLFDRLGVRTRTEAVTLALTNPRLLDPDRG